MIEPDNDDERSARIARLARRRRRQASMPAVILLDLPLELLELGPQTIRHALARPRIDAFWRWRVQTPLDRGEVLP